MPEPAVHLERRGHVAVVVLDNPAKHNAVDATMSTQLADAYATIAGDDDIRVAVIRGEGGRAFCAGGYIPSYVEGNVVGPNGSGQRTPLPKPWPIWKPFIAAIDGHCVGGGFGLALACDLRIASRDARIGPSGLRRGVIQGAQQTQRLIRLISFSKALELLLLSEYVSGEDAAGIGLVHRAVDHDEVVPLALEWAERIAAFSPWAVQTTKRLAYEELHKPWDEAFEIEEELTVASYRRPAAQEGFQAFVEQREPRFDT